MTRDSGYFRWLIESFVEDHRIREYRDPYSDLYQQMYRTSYYYLVHNDENRAEDGLYLRERFLNEHAPLLRMESVPEGPCTFLEFLIALAIRLKELLEDGEDIPVRVYFWELCNRLRLNEFTDDLYAEDSTPFIVDEIMADYMERNYDRCGRGGLFPLRRPCKDQRKEEVWYQMNAFLIQNDGFFTRR